MCIYPCIYSNFHKTFSLATDCIKVSVYLSSKFQQKVLESAVVLTKVF